MNPTSQLKIPVAVLISGTGSNLQALIDFQAQSSYQIQLVISNRPNVAGLNKAKQAKIPIETIDHTLFADRTQFDQEMIRIIDQHNIKIIVLAGFMRILTTEFTQHYLGSMLNIHPSLLPKYPGLNTHQKALEAKDKEHGLSIHFVTAELDGGPVIQQAKLAVSPSDTVESLKDAIQVLEHATYPGIVDLLAQGRLSLQQNIAYLDQEILSSPLLFESKAICTN